MAVITNVNLIVYAVPITHFQSHQSNKKNACINTVLRPCKEAVELAAMNYGHRVRDLIWLVVLARHNETTANEHHYVTKPQWGEVARLVKQGATGIEEDKLFIKVLEGALNHLSWDKYVVTYTWTLVEDKYHTAVSDGEDPWSIDFRDDDLDRFELDL